MIKEGERVDDLQLSNLKILQNPAKFCFGMDAVLLAGFAAAGKQDRVLDLCTGSGIIPILMEAKTTCRQFMAIEIQEEMADMARRSIAMNRQEDRITVLTGDVKEASLICGKRCFDVVTVNPPYMTGGHGLVNPELPKAIARHELLLTLEDVIREAALCLKPNGHFYMVHRPYRLAEIIRVLSKFRLELKRIRFVHPYNGREPNMLLVEAVLNGNPGVTVEPPLIVWSNPGQYSEEMKQKYGY